MKRFFFWFFVVLVAIALVRANQSPARPRPVRVGHGFPPVVNPRGHGPDGRPIGARKILEIDRDGRQIVLIDDRGNVSTEMLPDEVFATDGTRREVVEGLPVPVVPGSRVTEAHADTPRPPVPPQPPAPPQRPQRPRRPRAAVQQPKPADPAPLVLEPVVIKGQLSATETRAHDNVRGLLVKRVGEWLEPEVPRSWHVPEPLIDRLVSEVKIVPVEKPNDPVYKDYGPMYEAELRADLSPPRRAEIAEAYHHEQTLQKLGVLGVILLFVLAILGTVSSYIRADEVTKGYYTNKLRLAAGLAGAGAAMAAYHWLRS